MPQVLIEWQGGGPEAATWEDEMIIREHFPEFHLEEKVVPGPTSNDMI